MANPQDSYNSPMFVDQIAENSPMTNLAINFSSTTLSVSAAARRKLTLTNDEDSPMMVSPLSSNKERLLKSSLRFSGTPVRKIGVPRRLSHLGNENVNPMQSSPVKTSPSKFQAVRQLSSSSGKVRQPLEDYDPNSQDSGYCASEDSKSTSSSTDFHFAQPSGFAPRRSVADSPRRSLVSTSSTESDDGFSDFLLPLQDEEAQLPPALGGLISNPIINHGLTSEPSVLSFRNCISENVSPMSPMVEEDGSVGKKRASSAMDVTPVSKRHKPLTEANSTPSRIAQQHTLFEYGFKRLAEPRPLLNHSLSLEDPITPPHRPKFRHCLSESEAVIKRALHRSAEEELIGDFSRSFALPLVTGAHQDLKSITPTTLANLMAGKFDDVIESFQIIDCRYPYEYEGGHIRGARNIYTRDQLVKEFLENRKPLNPSLTQEDTKRNIVIFHCEFSSERGPGLSRFLRSKDRESNSYPALHFPEVYLLEGGYKAFFNTHSELCEPCAYRKMVDADKEELQHFRAKSKTWSGDKSSRVLKRSASFKRLGL